MHDQRNGLDIDMGWNGMKNGEEVVTGVYVYLIEVILEDGSTEIFAGDLTLLR